MQKGTDHHGTYRGHWCKLVLSNGDVVHDRFVESKSERLRFERSGWISRASIKSFEPFQRDPEKKEAQRIAIREIAKPVIQSPVQHVDNLENTPSSSETVGRDDSRIEVSSSVSEPPQRAAERVRPFVNRLPNGYMLSVYLPDALALSCMAAKLGVTLLDLNKPDERNMYRALTEEEEEKLDRLTAPVMPRFYGIEKAKPEKLPKLKASTKERRTRPKFEGDARPRYQPKVLTEIKGYQTCDFCGDKYEVYIIRKAKYRCCKKKASCKSAHVKAILADKKARA